MRPQSSPPCLSKTVHSISASVIGLFFSHRRHTEPLCIKPTTSSVLHLTHSHSPAPQVLMTALAGAIKQYNQHQSDSGQVSRHPAQPRAKLHALVPVALPLFKTPADPGSRPPNDTIFNHTVNVSVPLDHSEQPDERLENTQRKLTKLGGSVLAVWQLKVLEFLQEYFPTVARMVRRRQALRHCVYFSNVRGYSERDRMVNVRKSLRSAFADVVDAIFARNLK